MIHSEKLINCPVCGNEAEHLYIYYGEEVIRCPNSECNLQPGVSAITKRVAIDK